MTTPDDLAAEELAELRERFGFEDWPGPADTGMLVWNLQMTGRELIPWSMLEEPKVDQDGWPRAVQSWWIPPTGHDVPRIRLDVVETTSAAEARFALLRLLGEVQVPSMERVATEPPGEVSFALEGEGAVFFCRANLAVRLRSATEWTDPVVELARQWDTHLLDVSERAIGVVPSLDAARIGFDGEVVVGVAAPVEISARDALERPVSFKLISPNGALELSDGTPFYLAHTPGHDELTLVVSGPEGGTAVMTFGVDVVAPTTGVSDSQ